MVANPTCWKSNTIATAIASFMHANRPDVEQAVDFNAGKRQESLLGFDRDNFYFFDLHKARGGCVYQFSKADQKNILDAHKDR